jgi:orotate phosphoribosyltransferase
MQENTICEELMDKDEVMEVCDGSRTISAYVNEAGVLKDGHYILTSGRHATQSIQCAKLFEHATLTSEICSYLAERS